MGYEGWIALRFLKIKKERFFSVINFISIAGIAIGVTALIVVLGVMTGFDRELRDKIIGTNAHIIIEKEIGIRDFRQVKEKVDSVEGIAASTPYVQGNVFIEYGGQARGAIVRGIDTKNPVTKVEQYITTGNIEDLKGGTVILGSELAGFYGYTIGDKITLIAPGSGIAGKGWRYPLEVVGIFTSGMYDYDMNLILVNIPQAQRMFQLDENIASGIAVQLDDIYKAKEVKNALYKVLGYSFLVRTWVESNRNFFAALRLEKFAMFVILALIVLVASFNIASTLIVTVTSKVKDIGILKSIGVTKSSIRKIFTLEGLAIGIIGIFWGLIGGLGLAFLLKKYQFIKLPQDIYYVDRLPVLVELSDVLIIVVSAIIISFLATLYPAAKAANLEPVDALRYE